MPDKLAWFDTKPDATAEVVEREPIDPEVSARMVMRAALIETTSSRGWAYVERFAETVVRDLEKKSVDEDNDEKANGLRRDARGARKFKDDLFKRITLARNVNTDNGFVEVVTD